MIWFWRVFGLGLVLGWSRFGFALGLVLDWQRLAPSLWSWKDHDMYCMDIILVRVLLCWQMNCKFQRKPDRLKIPTVEHDKHFCWKCRTKMWEHFYMLIDHGPWSKCYTMYKICTNNSWIRVYPDEIVHEVPLPVKVVHELPWTSMTLKRNISRKKLSSEQVNVMDIHEHPSMAMTLSAGKYESLNKSLQ